MCMSIWFVILVGLFAVFGGASSRMQLRLPPCQSWAQPGLALRTGQTVLHTTAVGCMGMDDVVFALNLRGGGMNTTGSSQSRQGGGGYAQGKRINSTKKNRDNDGKAGKKQRQCQLAEARLDQAESERLSQLKIRSPHARFLSKPGVAQSRPGLGARPVRLALCSSAANSGDGVSINAGDEVAKAKARLVKAERELDAAQEVDAVDDQRVTKAELSVAKAEWKAAPEREKAAFLANIAKAEVSVTKAEVGVAKAKWKAAPEREKAAFLANIAKAEVSVAKAEVGVAKAEWQAAPESEKAAFLANIAKAEVGVAKAEVGVATAEWQAAAESEKAVFLENLKMARNGVETARKAYEKALNATTASPQQGSAPQAPPVAPAEYVAFAKSCAVPVNATRCVLEFPNGYITMENIISPKKTKVFVRGCYPKLYDRILESSNLGIPDEEHPPVFILGTPGTGKSLMRMYVCHRLLQSARDQNRSAYILFQKASVGHGRTTVYVIAQEAGKEATTYEFDFDLHPELQHRVREWEKSGKLVVSLVDVSGGEFQQICIRTKCMWFFSSPNKNLMDNADRSKTPCVDLYMPLFNLVELLMVQRELNLDIKPVNSAVYTDPAGVEDSSTLIQHRFELFGGSARAVLEDPTQTEKNILSALEKAELREGLGQTLRKQNTSLSSEFSHSVYHVDSNEDFDPTYKWASEYIKHRISVVALQVFDQGIETLLASENSPGTKGEMVEALFLQRFVLCTRAATKDNDLTLKSIGKQEEGTPPLLPPNEDKLVSCLRSFSDVKVEWHKKDDMAGALNQTARTASLGMLENGTAVLLQSLDFNIKAIDGILVFKLDSDVCVLLLQVTIAERHPAGDKAAMYLDHLIKAVPKNTTGALVFIIPYYRYVGWKAQKIADGPVKSIVQFALCPGMDPKDPILKGKRWGQAGSPVRKSKKQRRQKT